MTKQQAIEKLSKAVLKESAGEDLFYDDWNPNANMEVTLTIEEIRYAAHSLGWHPETLQCPISPESDFQKAWKVFIKNLNAE